MTVTINGTTGVTAPEVTLDNSSADGGQVVLKSSGYSNWNIDNYNGSLRNYYGSTVATTIDSSGNVGIGTSSPRAPLSFSNSVGTAGVPNRIRFYDDGGSTVFGFGLSSGQLSYNCADGSHVFYTGGTSPTERMRIDYSGNLLVGATSQINADKVGITFNGQTQNGIVLKTTYASTGSDYQQFYNSAGSIAGRITQNGTTTVAYTTSSDYRLKENIQPMQNALAVVQQLNPVTYTWKADGSDGQGFIAHELQAVVPDCVTGEKDAVDEEGNPVYQGIDTSFLVATLTKAIQELSAKNNSLEARLAALEAK